MQNTVRITGINMKSTEDGGTYTFYRMYVLARTLPMWMMLKAKEMDQNCNYINLSPEQTFEIEGYYSEEEQEVEELKLVYFWDKYETITDLDPVYHAYLYEEFKKFAQKYGRRLPDNSKLQLGDAEYEEILPEDVLSEWKIA